MECIKLRCEYQVDPIGIDVKYPRLSYEIVSDRQNVMQEAYRIVCSTSEQFDEETIVWDSGMVPADISNQIKYEGKPLIAMQRIYWRVMVKTNMGSSEYSKTAYFETGLLDSVWDARWITCKSRSKTEPVCPILKKKFKIEEKPVLARLFITALGMYKTYFNDEPMEQDILAPGWTSYNNHLQYQTYDVTNMLDMGENLISVMLGNGWYKGRIGFGDPIKSINFYGDTLSLLAQLVMIYPDGKTQTISTDDTWKYGDSPVLYSEIYDGEAYDARSENNLYDDLGETVIFEPNTKFSLIGQNTPGVRVIDILKPKEIISTPNGDTVIDFGQNMVGWVKFNVKGEPGDTIHIEHAEIMLDNEFYNVNMRSAKTEIFYTLKGGVIETFEPHFTFFGFRYIRISGYRNELDPADFQGIVISSGLEYTGVFKCSNEKVNKLYQNILWGQKGNFVDVPTDCPQRDERLGWTADTQVFTATACYNALCASFYEKWLKDVAYDQYPDGRIPSVVPDVLKDGISSSAWGDAVTIVPNTIYSFYKDKEMLSSMYESMKKWIEYIRTQGSEKTLWDTGFHYSDWLAKDGYGIKEIHGATPVALVATALYYYSTSLAAKTAGILENHDDEKYYLKLADRIKETFNREFVTPGGRVSGETQTAYTLALHYGLLDGDNIKKAADHLVKLVRREEHRITTGFVGTPYISHVLSSNGYNEDAYLMLLNEECPGWLYQINMGATTIWERWDSLLPNGKINSGSMNSFNHYAYGSIGQWLFAVVLGITPRDGFKTFDIAPKPSAKMGYARGGFDTLYGRIESGWEICGDKTKFEFVIPCNTKASVILPNAKINDIVHNGDAVECEEGLKLTLGSGKHSFVY